MDELWQRYRTFWTPFLLGLGIFLVGLIVVHALTTDPDEAASRLRSEARSVGAKVAPDDGKVAAVRANLEVLEARVQDWSRRLDQAALAEPLDTVVRDALAAALLRGADPEALREAVARPEGEAARRLLPRFDADAVAAGKALGRFDEAVGKLLPLLRSGDPNVGFSGLLSTVWTELKVRANRADVELKTDVLGFGGVSSVTRPILAQRLLNLSLVARVVDLAIRSGISSVQEVRLDQRQNPLGDDVFLREWPFTITLRGDTAALRPVLALFTDPARPIPVTSLVLTQPPRGSPLEGEVQMQATLASVIVRPEASLALEMEER